MVVVVVVVVLAGDLGGLLLLILAKAQSLALCPIPLQLKQGTMRNKNKIYEFILLKNFECHYLKSYAMLSSGVKKTYSFQMRFRMRAKPPPPFQCCTGKRQNLEKGNPTLRRGEGVVLWMWHKKLDLSIPIWQSVLTLLSPIVRDSKLVFAKVTGVVLIWNVCHHFIRGFGFYCGKNVASLLVNTKM